MQYAVHTRLINEQGKSVSSATIPCVDKAEAIALSDILNNFRNPGQNRFTRRAFPCVSGYSEIGKYVMPLHDLRRVKSEVNPD